MKKITKSILFLSLMMMSLVFSGNVKADTKCPTMGLTDHSYTNNKRFGELCEKYEPNCAFISQEGCFETKEPTSSSVPCSSIKADKNGRNIEAYKECQLRRDCKWNSTTSTCGKNPYYNEVLSKNTNGNTNTTDITDIVKKGSIKRTCADVKEFTGIWLFLRVSAPFIVIMLGSLDFLKATMAGDEKKMKEAKGKLPKRIIVFILFIVLPFIVQFIFKYIGSYGSQNVCLVKCIVNNDTSSKACN